MTQQEIINGNKLIAEFMGSRFYDSPTTDGRIFFNIPILSTGGKYLVLNGIQELNEMMFHSSFDWLMPVVDKIESVGYEVTFCRKIKNNKCTCLIYAINRHFIADSDSKIESVYLAVIDFINWYNNQK
jgi:hypothetical protein